MKHKNIYQNNCATNGQNVTRLISQEEVCVRVNLSRTTIYRRVKEGNFPQSIRISAGRIAWIEDEIETYIRLKKSLINDNSSNCYSCESKREQSRVSMRGGKGHE